MKKIALILIFLILLFACSAKNNIPKNLNTYTQMVNITNKNQILDFKAIVKINDYYLNVYMFSDIQPGSIKIEFINNEFIIKKNKVPIPDFITKEIAKDLFITYFGGNKPYKAKQKYSYQYKINSNKKIVYENNKKLYEINFIKNLIIIKNVKHNYEIKILNDNPISLS
jgi:hypothetical protein